MLRQWQKDVWIASFKETLTNSYGSQISVYNEPLKYRFNFQPVSGEQEIMAYGNRVFKMFRAFVPISYNGKINENDLVYFDGVTPEGENKPGEKANYIVVSVRPQNRLMAVYIEKLQKGRK